MHETTNRMKRTATIFLTALLLAPLAVLVAADSKPSVALAAAPQVADWFKDARLGVFMHFWANSSNDMALVDAFDVPAVTRQLKEMGAGYLVLTLGQNAGFYNAPNAVYDRFLGCAPGERCSRRDLPLDLHRALQAEGIRLMLYLPCQTPNQDARAQRAFGLPEGKKDQPINEAFARQWAQVIHEWSARYGDKVAGWWFDGGYRHIQFNDAIAAIVPPKTPRKSKLLSVAPEKGGDLFVEACARLRGMGRDVSGVLIGEGPALATWKELARRRGVDGRIVFPGWRPDVADWLAVLDIYMAPSLEESFGLAILEAQAAGLPVVAARVGGIPEVVTDRENALLVPRGDVDALASAVTELLDNPALARRLGDNGRRNVEERFSIENTAARYADVYTAAFARCNDRASGGSMARR